MTNPSSRPLARPLHRCLLLCLLVLAALAIAVTNAPALHLLGSEPVKMFPASGPARAGRLRLAAVFLSGDMGFKFGMGAHIAQAIADRGIPVVGINSPVVFAHHHSRTEADAVVAGAIRLALARTGADRILLMAQSYGADIVATAAPDLPPDLRARILAIDLTVPAQDVYFRADPSTLAYLGAPDARPLQALRAVHWAPVICVYGREETDSLCPGLTGTGARVIGLPGNHHLNHDRAGVIAATLGALRAAVPEAEV
ncbi:AcvB/VirJ family lysyl-phosphatidylglycerol hydrolase [Novosphingobium sp. P6W]|uniref:AcvB/VirJ family lysyl-phosphatidylglycerol hydrolase n=1 Tax=Novosphingobium sp. P6W TaxID=1609758 RepID=UPI0005C2D9C4|nr:AcvB/VirJ family lysyl-phosphatidylglycerol hydrolase [Novosphingobium sp. P6W]AXB79290.1 type IV secretion system protein VirJ [Novosphingobium sp. P6W]KIS30563.1 type IV secretion protein VirJ [Novosphingobium sp. P6W]